MPIPLLAIFSCGVGVSPAPEFDEKDFCKRSNRNVKPFNYATLAVPVPCCLSLVSCEQGSPALYATPVNPGGRSLEALVKAQYPWVNARFSPTRVSNQAAITASYNENLEGKLVKDVYVLSPNRRYLIRVSGPAQGELLKLALSTFAFK